MATSNIDVEVKTKEEEVKVDQTDMQSKQMLEAPLSIPERLQLEPISRKGDNPQIYQLHINKMFQNDTFTHCAVGSSSLKLDPLTMVSERVLILVGATGTGKTTLINGIANYIFGTKWEDDFRLKVIHNEGQQSQAFGQTKQITAYTFPEQKGSPLSYTLTIIDTPGFGDSDGVEHDRYIIEQVSDFFSLKPPKGVALLHGIGFVVKASDCRLTPTQLYVFTSILSIFGKDVEENIYVIITFCDAEKPLVLHALKEAGIPYQGNGFKFNNSALFADKAVCSKNEDDDSDDDFDFNSQYFKMGMKSFKHFFKQLEKAEPKSLQMTKEVLEERKRLEILIQGLQEQIVCGIGKITELQEEEKALVQHKAAIEANENFTYTVPVVKRERKETTKRVTNCISCNFTCHFDCVYNKDKRNCKVIEKNYCTVCPGKCHYSSHINQPYYYESTNMEEKRTYFELKERYDDATSQVDQSEAVLSSLNRDLMKVKSDVHAKVKEAHKTLQRLEEIALNPDPLTESEYIELCIEAEKREAKPGWMERIDYFHNILKRNKYIWSVRNLPYENVRRTCTSEDPHWNLTQHSDVMHDTGIRRRPESFATFLSYTNGHETTL